MSAPYASSPPYATAVPVAPVQPDHSKTKEQPKYKLPENNNGQVNENQLKRLVQQGFTKGLAKSLSTNNEAFPYRIWVVDNSGSMMKTDGHRIVHNGSSDIRFVSSSRWDELRSCVQYHIEMSGLLEAPTSFRLLNHPGVGAGTQQFGVAESPGTASHDTIKGMEIMNKVRPSGATPLTRHITEIRRFVKAMAPDLAASGKRVVIVLATDGLPTDAGGTGSSARQRFVDSLRLLEGLPVWVVIRLCTDEDSVVDFYNDLDEQLELSLEVLDDYCAEAKEVYEHNSWLNYALPLHRCREMGYHDRVFDLIDERPLTKSEFHDFCVLLFGQDSFDGIADPDVDWHGFVSEIGTLLQKEQLQWNPIRKRLTPWIDMKRLEYIYNRPVGCTCTIL